MKHSLFGFRPTRHLALGLGAAGLVLGASGATAAATALIQPAGALSVQVPAVAVIEQNVNAAGRIRVALPKTSVGVNGSVSVSNLPVNSAGRLQTQNGSAVEGVTHSLEVDPTVAANANVTLLDISGPGVLVGVGVGNSGADCNAGVLISLDGVAIYDDGIGFPHNWFGNTSHMSGGPNGNGGYGMSLWPPSGLPFHKSLVVQYLGQGCPSLQVIGRVWYTTPG